MKEILNNLWKSIAKYFLAKTTLDEQVAEKVSELKEQVDKIDELDNTKKTKPKSK